MNHARAAWDSVPSSRTLACEPEELGVELPTVLLVDNLLYFHTVTGHLPVPVSARQQKCNTALTLCTDNRWQSVRLISMR